ncbi:MAG: hypothetical protein IKE52_07260 [Mogibacterium sp.]|nr:hypothetical protein [Mogibacterium sp.]
MSKETNKTKFDYLINNTRLSRILIREKGLCALPEDNWKEFVFDFKVSQRKFSSALLYTDCPDISREDLDITPFDIAVTDAIYTIWNYANSPTFTIGLIHKIMTGYLSKSLTQKKRTQIKNSIEKLEKINIIIDCTDYVQEMRSTNSNIFEGQFISVEKTNKVSYKLLEPMPLYRYMEAMGHMLKVPIDNIERIGSATQSYDERVLLRRELCRTILILKNEKNNYKSTQIYYSPRSGKKGCLLLDIGLPESDFRNRETIKRIHEKTKAILESLKREKGEKYSSEDILIHGFDELELGEKTIGVEIILQEPKTKKRQK